MSHYDLFDDYEPEQPATLEEEKPRHAGRPPRRPRETLFNVISLFFVAATIAVCIAAAALVQNPTVPFNPFPPPTPQPTPTLFVLPGGGGEQTGEVTPQGDGQTPQPTGAAGETPAANVTLTPTLRPSPTGVTPPPLATNTPAAYPYTLQNDTVTKTQYFGSAGCNYMAIAGQVFDVDGNPMIGVPVVVKGDQFFEDALVFSGSSPQYGKSGYEVQIGQTPVQGTFTVQLFSDQGLPLSEEVTVKTSNSCDENLIIVNFVQNQPTP